MVATYAPMTVRLPDRADLLERLTAFHDEILAHLDGLANLTRADLPDPVALTRIRLRLTQASRQRRQLLDGSVLPVVQPLCRPDDMFGLEKLKAEATAHATHSSHHIGQWTVARIAQDWPGYQKASAIVRTSMRSRVAAEQRILYPLLQRADHYPRL